MKLASGSAASIITPDRDHHRRHHDRQFVGHADRGQDRIDREHHVEQQDLHDRGGEAERLAAAGLSSVASASPASTLWWISLVAFQTRNRPPAIRIRSRHENAVSKLGIAVRVRGAGQPEIEHRLRPARRSRRSRTAGRVASPAPGRCRFAASARVRLGQLVRQDRDEDEIVDAEHDLHHDQRGSAAQAAGSASSSKDRHAPTAVPSRPSLDASFAMTRRRNADEFVRGPADFGLRRLGGAVGLAPEGAASVVRRVGP